MGRIAELLDWALSRNGDARAPEVKGDPGGGAVMTAEHFAPPGVDSQPLQGDFFATHDGPGTGDEIVSGYHDPSADNRKAGPGETRTYARDSSGAVACEIWCKADGAIVVSSIAGGSTINLNGVEIDQDGNISTPGNIEASGDIDGSTVTGSTEVVAGSLALSTHVHISAAAGSPTGPGQAPPPP